MKKIIFLLLFCAGVVGQELSELFCNKEPFERAHVGICIVDLATGKQVYGRNAEQFFIPASLQKIPLSAAALSLLGEDYVFHTDLEYEGELNVYGALQGNVWVIGGGDPTLSLDIFSEWKTALKEQGIRKIDGRIIVDTSYFETALASPYWSFEDLGNYYGAGASALAINQNLYRITFEPGKKEGSAATVLTVEPEIPYLITRNEVRTGPQGSGDLVNIFGTEYSPIQFYRGTVPIDQPTFTVKAAIPDPALFCGRELSSKIEATEGIEVIRDKQSNASQRKRLMRKASPPLKEIIAEMNRHSINLYAEHLLKTLGSGKAAQGAKALEQFLKNLGIPAQVRDGSGLSRNNLITPKGFVSLLRHLRKSPLYASFPQPGEEGTLKNFPLLTGATFRAKTGSMSNVYNLGGYLTLASGKEYAFCICCNNYQGPLKEVRKETYLLLDLFVKKH